MKGVLFNDIHSYYDLGLILSKVEIEPASPKTNYINIPCSDGSIDLTDANGEVKYNDRKIKLTFTNIDGNFEKKKMNICNLLNGVKCKITLEKDEEFYYLGRCSIDSYNSKSKIGTIVVSVVCNPYKLRQDKTIRKYVLDGNEKQILIENGRKSVVPIIENENALQIIFKNQVIDLDAGIHIATNIVLSYGTNRLTLIGNGIVKFTYQEGEL